MNSYIRVAEVAKQLDINHNTLRRWLIQYDTYLVTKRDKKMKYIHEDSLKTLILIKDYYAEFKKEHEILDLLASNSEVIKNVKGEEVEEEQLNDPGEQPDLKPIPADLIEMIRAELVDEVHEQFLEMHKKLDQQQEFNRQLIDRLDQQQKYIDERMNERDKKLVTSLRVTMEEQQQANSETAASQGEKKGFWGRLFGK